VPGVCLAGRLQLGKPTIRGAWSRRAPGLCVPTKRATLPLIRYRGRDGDCVVYTHRDCACNELLALRNRHQVGGNVDPKAMLGMAAESQRLFAKLYFREEPQARDSYAQVLRHRVGGKRKRWERAIRSIQRHGLTKSHAKVRMFLKADKYTTPLDNKAPRCIQFRTDEYCVILARYLYPIERKLWTYRDSRGLSVFAKSRNSWQRAQDLREHFDSFATPVALLLDHSKWDAHVSNALLQIEHDFYRSHYPGDHTLDQLLRYQLGNFGRSNIGTKYFTPGTRMSGDMNTALGNSLLNYLILKSWLRASGVEGTIYCDGDDSVVMVESADEQRLIPVSTYMPLLGMETKVERATEFEHVEFCQSRPVCVSSHWRMVRNPQRVLGRAGWTTYPVQSRTFARRLLKSIGLCELACGSGVPVIQSFALELMRLGSGPMWRQYDRLNAARLEGKLSKILPSPITMDTRLSFEEAWNITVAEQISIEKSMCTAVDFSAQPVDTEVLAEWLECFQTAGRL
jgi:hypothetical protein